MSEEKDYSILDTLFPTHILVETQPNPIFIKNEELQYVFINRAYESAFGVKMADMLGKTVLDVPFLPENDKVFYHKEDREMMLHGTTSRHIFQYLFADSKMHTCLYWSSGFIHESGSRGLVGTIVDISDQSKTIAALQQELQSLATEKREFEEKSVIDSLTCIHNRRFFDGLLHQHAIAAVQDGSSFSCIMIDIDHFKRVNDTFGHLTGDEVLKNMARCFQNCSRYGDMLCRYGGEEFALLLPGCKLEEAMMIAERIRAYTLEMISLPDGSPVTISAGCGEYVAGEEELAVLKRADEALYTAKRTGRNRVCASRHSGYTLDE